MNDKAKIFKVAAMVGSSFATLYLVIMIIFSAKEGFTIYPYLFWLIAFISCILLWKMYFDAKKA
jgi:hypothetical protein